MAHIDLEGNKIKNKQLQSSLRTAKRRTRRDSIKGIIQPIQ